MISHEFAAQFGEEWIAVWNSRDLDRIFPHYADDFEMASPYIAEVAGGTFQNVEGKSRRSRIKSSAHYSDEREGDGPPPICSINSYENRLPHL